MSPTSHFGPVFAFDAVSFGVATVTIFLVVGGRRRASAGPSAEAGTPGVLASVGVGIRYARSDPALRSLILLIAAFNFAFTGPVLVGLPFLADHVLGGGSASSTYTSSPGSRPAPPARCGVGS